MAATQFEIELFMLKFRQLASVGINSNLNFNCSNGNIFVNFAAELGRADTLVSTLFVADTTLSRTSPSKSSKRSNFRRKKKREEQRNTRDQTSSSAAQQPFAGVNILQNFPIIIGEKFPQMIKYWGRVWVNRKGPTCF